VRTIAICLLLWTCSASAATPTPSAVVKEAWEDVAKTFVEMPAHRAEWQKAKATYVKSYRTAAEAHAAIREMLMTLNNTRLQWLSPEDVKTILPQFSGPLPESGLAYLSFEFLPDEKKVITALAGSPGAMAGVKTGDTLQAVNGTDVAKMSPGQLIRLLDRVSTKPMNLALLRSTNMEHITIQPIAKALEPVTLTTNPADMSAEIVIREFTVPALKQFQDAVKTASAKGTKEYTLDVRNNPGGLVDAMLDMASLFVSDKDFTCSKDQSGKTTCRKTKSGTPVEGNVTILVNEGTASAAELLAVGFQRTKRGQVIGCRSYGHGYGGQLFTLSDGSALLIPDSIYLDPDGQPIEGRGVTPDLVKCPAF
jgi:carboxyl-terminal processing protease